MSWEQVIQSTVMWGPGILILVGLFKLLRRPPEFIGQFIGAQKDQAVAMKGMAGAIERAAGKGDAMQAELIRGITKLEINDIAILRELDWIRKNLDGREERGPRT